MTDLFDMLVCVLEEPELRGSGQPNGQRILGSRQLLHIKDVVVWLQEDRPQVCHQRALSQLLQKPQHPLSND